MQNTQEQQLITSQEDLLDLFLSLEKKCLDMEDFKDPGMKPQEIIQKFIFAQRCIQHLSLFSQNEKVTDIHTQNLKYICLPYHIGYLFGKISDPRKPSVLQSKTYLNAFLNLCRLFNTQDEVFFPKNALTTWKNLSQIQAYRPTRDELVTNMKQKKNIQQRYNNAQKIKDEKDQRQSILDFITLCIYEAITALKMIEEELQILNYKQSIQNDEKAKQKHQQDMQKPIPKLTYYQIKKPEELNQQFLSNLPKGEHQCNEPTCKLNHRQDLITQVWQENANKPTMSLEQVGDLQYDNMVQRNQRQKKYAEQNKVDTDSDKQEVDDRDKKKARQWDDWKDQNQKGAGNKNKGRM